jgi:hypothetical protein
MILEKLAATKSAIGMDDKPFANPFYESIISATNSLEADSKRLSMNNLHVLRIRRCWRD